MLPPFDAWVSSQALADVATATRASPSALAERQSRRLAALLRAAEQGSPLYRRILAGRSVTDTHLRDLPVAHKAELMHRFSHWVTDPALNLANLRAFVADRSRMAEPHLGRYLVWESSGSNGEPGLFVQDAAAMAVYDALEALRKPVLHPARRVFDPWSMGERIVFVGATEGHFASTVSIERLRRLYPALACRVHSVSFLQPLAAWTAELQALAPTVIATYPSAAVLLAEEHQAGRLPISPCEVWTGGETLSPAMRRFVQQAFGCPVANSYGASEFLTLAAECNHGALHVNSDWVILESVDAQGREVPPGEFGATTLLTNLANAVQPLIRYDLGDRIAVQPHACPCGSHLPVIEVQGRDEDVLHLAQPGTPGVSVLPLAVSTVLEDDAGLFDFQLVQRGPSDLLLRTGLGGVAGERTLQRAIAVLTAFLAAQGARQVHIEGRCNAPAERGRSGKIRRVVIGGP